ncbi:MAG: hypothetical protein HYX25_06465 [Candidatus Solibacter usitatus]|nr:hypothetical protein [Candidatus Solibacter usitatus]
MDLFLPFFLRANRKDAAQQIAALTAGKGEDGRLARQRQRQEEFKVLAYHSPSLTFDHELAIDSGGRDLKVMYLGKGNTTGDAVVSCPRRNSRLPAISWSIRFPTCLTATRPSGFRHWEKWRVWMRKSSPPDTARFFHDKHAGSDERPPSGNWAGRVSHPGQSERVRRFDPVPRPVRGDDKDPESFDGMAKHLLKIVVNEALLR